MEFVSSELSGTDFVASDSTDAALFTSEFLAARLSTLEVCVSDLYCRVRPSYGGESRLHERDQLYGHGVKVSQSKLRRLRAKRIRYRLWSTARGPDSSCLVRAGICAPRYYRNFCSDDSEEEEWVEHTCGTQTDMDAVELAGNSLCSQCSDCGTQTDPCVHIACGTQTDRCVLFVGEEEKEECHRVHVDRGDASLRMNRYCFKRVGAIESSKLRTSELHATNGSSVESTAVWSSVDAVGSSSAVGSSTGRSAVGSSTVRSSADAVVDAVGSSTAGSSAVGSTAVWSSADAVGSSMNGSSADRPSLTRSECQAARDWALVCVDVSALWRELHRLPRQELQIRIEALNAYRLQMGIESSEEDDSRQGRPQSSTSRSALTRSGKKHRKRHR
ncbi:unnamed protein product [Prorocentrum cordatum]|uniref:Uncharacterized protein n=1 Tax=Prorocentrum cordatum TaxID=2364126 RepID=A0ABN9PBH6_9DINO|nr:unnamed protein product [Polarella glacialis]